MALQEAVSTLSEGERELFYLVFQAELRLAEAAELMGVPLGTVKSRLAAIRSKLRQRLKEEVWE